MFTWWRKVLGGSRREATGGEAVIELPRRLSVLPLRNAVLFPGGVLPLRIDAEPWRALIRDAVEHGGLLVVATQRNPSAARAAPADMFDVGTLARITRVAPSADGTHEVTVSGLGRVRLTWVLPPEPWLRAELALLDTERPDFEERQALTEQLRSAALDYLDRRLGFPHGAREVVLSIPRSDHLVDLVAANIGMPLEEQQRMLETADLRERLERALAMLREDSRRYAPGLKLMVSEPKP